MIWLDKKYDQREKVDLDATKNFAVDILSMFEQADKFAKNELYPLWRFKTPEKAQQSCDMIYNKFTEYLDNDDFVGADMAKKYLHMGFTRSRRYWNHSSGKKWINDGEWKVLPYDRNEQRFMDSSLIFQEYWKRARTNEKYLRLKEEFKNAIIEMES